MKKLLLIALTLATVLGACSNEDPEPSGSNDVVPAFGELTPAAAEPTPAFGTGEITLESDDAGTKTIRVQIAEEPQQREIGLMGRTSLPDDTGMLFIFPGEFQGGFWMKNTLIPLSIAFIDSDGVIVDILDMQPCEAEPCDIYTPDNPYVQALEVNIGAFEGWGIAEGDTATLDS